MDNALYYKFTITTGRNYQFQLQFFFFIYFLINDTHLF